jgi:1-acyl-sn-glycerol-3-phosphate acyltransferase
VAATSPSRTSLGLRLVRTLARGLLGVFYRRVEVIGAGQVPACGPLIVAANHQNALVDPMLLLASIPRSLVPLAKAPLFRHPIIGPFLKLAGAIPVRRRQDAGRGPASNEAMFESATATLGRGGGILIFPEGVSQPEPALMPLRTGAARMLLGAPREVAAATSLLPVGLVFQDPERFRAGWALVLVGRPVETADCLRLYEAEPEEAVRRLTERLAEDLRRLIAEVGDRQTLRLVEEAEAIWLAEHPERARDAAARAEWRRRAASAYRYLLPREPARVGALRGELERYVKDLEDAHMGEPHLSASFPPHVVLRYALVQGAALALGLPLALWGIASHALPYGLTALAVRLVRPDADVEATSKLAAGLFLYPLAWIAEGWLAVRLGGGGLLALFAALLVPSGFFALGWSERLRTVARDARAWLAFLGDRDLHRHLAERRRAIMRELAALVDLVPASALSDASERPT